MLISPAYAQAAGGGGLFGGGLMGLLPFLLIFVVFYFLLIRPQQTKMKKHREMIGSLRRGDRIVTGGGIVGRVTRVEGDNELIVEIAPDVRVRVRQATVAELMARTGSAAREEVRPQKEKAAPEKRAAKADYYSVLGVRRTAAGDKISKSYQRLAQKYHHDTNPSDSQAKAKFEEITEAYDTLKDAKLRKIYDSLGHDEYLKIQNT